MQCGASRNDPRSISICTRVRGWRVFAALAALFPALPLPAAEALAAAARKPARRLPAPPELPEGVEWMGDSRFSAFFARRHAVIRWDRPGRELVTGCYLTSGDSAEFVLNPGESRFVILRESGEDA